MLNSKDLFFKKNPWTWKELILLLVLVLILVPFFIEFLLLHALTEVFQNELYSGTLIGLIMAIIFTLGLYFIAIRPKQLSWKEVGLKSFTTSYWKQILGWTALLIISSIGLAIVIESLFTIGTENSKTESLQTRLTGLNIMIAFVSAAVISPIYEEIFYRGFLYRWFRNKYGIMPGLLISSFIFMLVHIPTFNSLPYRFFIWLGLCMDL